MACKVCFFYRTALGVELGICQTICANLRFRVCFFEASEVARLRRDRNGSRVGAQAEHIEDSKVVHRRFVGKMIPGPQALLDLCACRELAMDGRGVGVS